MPAEILASANGYFGFLLPGDVERQRMTRNLTIGLVILNAMVILAHGSAHSSLGVLLSSWQRSFVATVIVPGPVVAVLLLLRKHLVHGYALLLVSMLGSLIFGVYYHFVAVSPDHVAHLPPGDGQQLFRVTAVSMALVQAFGVGVAAVGLRAGAPREKE